LAAFLVLAFAAAGHAQAKSNLSGEWKVNISRSDYGPMPAPQSAAVNIRHEDPSFKVAARQSSERGESSWELTYTTDGKECSNQVRGNLVKSTVKWEGDTLVFDSKLSVNGNEISLRDQWSLSGDGKVLTVKRHFSTSQGEGEQRIVYEKQ